MIVEKTRRHMMKYTSRPCVTTLYGIFVTIAYLLYMKFEIFAHMFLSYSLQAYKSPKILTCITENLSYVTIIKLINLPQ